MKLATFVATSGAPAVVVELVIERIGALRCKVVQQ